MSLQITICPTCFIVYQRGYSCIHCGLPNEMIPAYIDTRHHAPNRKPKYPRWLLQQLKKQIEFAYPYTRIAGNDFHNNEDERKQNAKRDTYVIAFLNGIDIMRPYFNAFNTIDEMTSNYKTGDGTKIGRINKVISNLKKKANE